MDEETREFTFGNGNRMLAYSDGKSPLRQFSSLNGIAGLEDDVLEALDELDDHLVMEAVHEEEIGHYLEDNPDVTDKPGLLLAAGAVPLHEMTQVRYESFRAYSMGDTVVVEEKAESGWQSAATVPHDVAVLVAQARAKNRAGALMLEHDELRKAASRELEVELERRFGDDADSFFGASPVQSAAQTMQNQPAVAASANQSVSANITLSGKVAQKVAEKVKTARLEDYSVGFSSDQ